MADEEIKKGDFVELDFIARVFGRVFDTTVLQEAKKAGLVNDKNSEKFKPIKICVGEKMIIQGLDEALSGKKQRVFSVLIGPEKAFGKRNPSLMKTMPMSVFSSHNINPVNGALFQFDNMVGKVVGISGGRVTVDFNNPLSGKSVDYEVRVKRIINDKKEKIDALVRYYFSGNYSFENNIVKVKEMPEIIQKILSKKLEKLGVKLAAEKKSAKNISEKNKQ